jgi:hypothetical protein
MDSLFERITYLFDPLHHFWEHERMHRRFALGLVAVFLVALAGIELNRQGLMPSSLAAFTPTDPGLDQGLHHQALRRAP